MVVEFGTKTAVQDCIAKFKKSVTKKRKKSVTPPPPPPKKNDRHN